MGINSLKKNLSEYVVMKQPYFNHITTTPWENFSVIIVVLNALSTRLAAAKYISNSRRYII